MQYKFLLNYTNLHRQKYDAVVSLIDIQTIC